MHSSIRYEEPKGASQQVAVIQDGEKLQNGLAKLILTLVDVVRQVLEKQALRRVESGTLTKEEVERLGLAFMELKAKIEELTDRFGLRPDQLNTELGALLRTPDGELGGASLVDVIDRVLDKGAVVAGQVRISVADIDLVGLDLFATLYPIGVKPARPVEETPG